MTRVRGTYSHTEVVPVAVERQLESLGVGVDHDDPAGLEGLRDRR